MLRIGIPKEILDGETRVAVVPREIVEFKKEDCEVVVEMDAGEKAFFSNAEYIENGAMIIPETEIFYGEADIILKIQPPRENKKIGKHEVDMMKPGSVYIGLLNPLANPDVIEKMLEKKITSFAMEYIPRIARAQSMDVLTSMASVSGYKAVLIAAEKLGKLFPHMITAAGRIAPARVLVIGAGVAGLQAIATARRLDARVEAFDVRPAAREQVQSLGAQFIEMELPEDAETTNGYAKEMSDNFLKKEREVITARLPKNDVVITTAQVFGKKPPILITEEMLSQMKKGSVIVDLAVEQGGNCELAEPGKVITKYGVIICGPVNIPATVPVHASELYSKNITNFLKILYSKETGSLNFEDEIIKSTCITHNGNILNELFEKTLQKGGEGK